MKKKALKKQNKKKNNENSNYQTWDDWQIPVNYCFYCCVHQQMEKMIFFLNKQRKVFNHFGGDIIMWETLEMWGLTEATGYWWSEQKSECQTEEVEKNKFNNQ